MLQSWTPSDKTFCIRAWVLIGSVDKIDWLTQNCVSDSKRPSQNKRFVCKHHAVSLSFSLSLRISLSLSLSLSLYDLLSKFVNLLDWKTVEGRFITTCEKTQMSLCKCAFTTQIWGADKVYQASPLWCWMVTTQTTTWEKALLYNKQT